MKVAIIGAGVTGLACAERLQASGASVTIYEKSRDIGGRVATRRKREGHHFDHGAQSLNAEALLLKTFISDGLHSGTLVQWPVACNHAGHVSQTEFLIGSPTMKQWLRASAEEQNIQFNQRVQTVNAIGAVWELLFEDGTTHGPFDIVISTVPVRQARLLLTKTPELLTQMKSVEMSPCWTAMLAFDRPIKTDTDVYQAHGAVSSLVRNSTKPDRDNTVDCWVVQMNAEWSKTHIEEGAEDILESILPMVEKIIGETLPQPKYQTAHRWRYAQTQKPLGKPFARNDDRTLFVGGDWCLGPCIEHGVESGVAIASCILAET